MGFPSPSKGLLLFLSSRAGPRWRSTEAAAVPGICTELLCLFSFHNSDAVSLSKFRFPGGEGCVTGDTFTFVNGNQN